MLQDAEITAESTGDGPLPSAAAPKGEELLPEPAGATASAGRSTGDHAADARELAAADAPRAMDGEIAASVDILAEVALQQSDPVAALEEGLEALAEALAERDIQMQQRQLAGAAARERVEAQRENFTQAYRHARLHRVGELVDLGYSLDHAVAITNANEAEIRARAAAAGSDPDDVIYRYAMMHGYQPPARQPAPSRHLSARDRHDGDGATGPAESAPLARLAALGDEAFAEATAGSRWLRIHGQPLHD